MSGPLTSEEQQEAARRIVHMAGLLDEALEMMEQCPFPEELSRVSSAMAILQSFQPGHHALMSAVAIERLSRVAQKLEAVVEDIEGGEDFFINLTAGLIMTPQWAKDTDRNAKIKAVAKAVHSECNKSQLALLTAIGMVRLSEGGLGPKP